MTISGFTRRCLIPALLVSAAFLGAAARRDEPSGSDGRESFQEGTQMPRPGPEHKWLGKRAGSWEITSRFRMTPEAPWVESKGTETCEMVCGGFWQSSVQKGTFMNMPFEGRMWLGYDQIKKKFVGSWIDNYGSWMSIMEGSLSKDGKVLTLHSDMLDPMSGKTVRARMVTTILNDDKSKFEMYMPGPDGKEFMTMEQTAVRRK